MENTTGCANDPIETAVAPPSQTVAALPLPSTVQSPLGPLLWNDTWASAIALGPVQQQPQMQVPFWSQPQVTELWPQACQSQLWPTPLKTCTHVSYQQISILTPNFNTSFVGHLTNVATLEYFTLVVFFSVFVECCSRIWLGCFERYTWLAVLTRRHVFSGHGMLFSSIPRKLSCPWYCCCLVDSGVETC